MAKSRLYGCKVPPGGSKKGCGGGAKVVNLEKQVEKMAAEIEEQARRAAKHERNLKALEKQGRAHAKKLAKKK